jgi:hypothetical protein
MSVAEMKLAAFEKLAVINEEKALKEILEHLEKLSLVEKQKVYNLSRHFNDLSNQYDETLKKLAQ